MTDNKIFIQQAVKSQWREWHIHMNCLNVLSRGYTSVMRGDRRVSVETFTPAERGHGQHHLTTVVQGSVAQQQVSAEKPERLLLSLLSFSIQSSGSNLPCWPFKISFP